MATPVIDVNLETIVGGKRERVGSMCCDVVPTPHLRHDGGGDRIKLMCNDGTFPDPVGTEEWWLVLQIEHHVGPGGYTQVVALVRPD